jgi:hypothetical protein
MPFFLFENQSSNIPTRKNKIYKNLKKELKVKKYLANLMNTANDELR